MSSLLLKIRGITPNLTPGAKLVVIVLMFAGRIGALSFGIALFSRRLPETILEGEEDLAV
ncbi:hypothetical protein VB715_00455 [Crocosphaera sp. UHCC 0190]|uniref:hypothetical protein n=1 Tax=Crocosphaera sp. UHCC 0190 TaxID=3110246 RepID=UPI002B20F7A4|nr:hypothetical protein [Crocosphaera sp. UHCC 0190]MEA5508225.1 hypothetical protein [Crocosphaera sp. UHCC 0190]